MGKLSELRVSRSLVEDPIETGEEETELPAGPGRSRHREQEPSQVVEDFVNQAFDLVPLEADDTAPGPSRQGRNYGYSQPDDFVDERIEEDPFPTAAKVIRMDRTLHEKWRALFGHEDSSGDVSMGDAASDGLEFAPFASELDWRVANWAIQEGIGHKSLDRLLAIPGVSSLFVCHTLLLNHAIHVGGGEPWLILSQYSQAPSGRR